MNIVSTFGLSSPVLVVVAVGSWIACSWLVCQLAIHVPRSLVTGWRQEAFAILGTEKPVEATKDDESTYLLSMVDKAFVSILVAASIVAPLLLSETQDGALSGITILLVMVLLATINVKHYILPDSIVLPALWAGFLIHVIAGDDMRQYILGTTFGYAVLYAIWGLTKLSTKKDTIGRGDMKVMALLGAWFGTTQLLNMYLLLVACVFIGMIIAAVRTDSRPQPTGIYYLLIAMAMTLY